MAKEKVHDKFADIKDAVNYLDRTYTTQALYGIQETMLKKHLEFASNAEYHGKLADAIKDLIRRREDTKHGKPIK